MSTYRLFGILFISSVSVLTTKAYDIGCIYPSEASLPWNVRERVGDWISEFHNPSVITETTTSVDVSETPMVIRDGYYWSGCQTTCLHYHDPRVADPFTNKPLNLPEGFTLPPFMQNAFSITMCMVQCYAHFANSWGESTANDFVEWAKTEAGFQITTPHGKDDLKEKVMAFYDEGGDRTPLFMSMADAGFDPYHMGHIAGLRVMMIADNDGWNANGAYQYSPEEGKVPCTGSCRPYQDTIGYTPKPNPRSYPDLSTDDDKYSCTGLCRNWQPLQEGTSYGSIKQQEHVVPHIGTHARTFLRNVTSTLEDPKYDLYNEALKVIEQVKMTSSDYYKKEMVRFFDDKLQVRALIRQNMRDHPVFRPAIPFGDYILFVYGMTLAEYDAVIQAWHEKLRHDLVRPTTYIKHWDTDVLETFGGDMDHDGPVMIKARDFEATIRVMPHSEFPSGSSCLCTAYMEFVDGYTSFYHNATLTDIKTRTLDRQVTFADMTEVRDICGESRLWGGMHFEASIPAGVEICEGIGDLGVQWVDTMKDNTIMFEGEEFGRDDGRPRCEM